MAKERPWLKWVLILPGIAFIIYLVFSLLRNQGVFADMAHRRVRAKYPDLDPTEPHNHYEEKKDEYKKKVAEETAQIQKEHASHIKHMFDSAFGGKPNSE